jgi:hypothetical protein
MKKIALLSVAAAALLFSACEKKGNSYEFAQILYPSYSGKLLYADQTEDSIKFATTFDWTLSLGADWVSANPDSMYGVVPDGYYMINKVPLHFEVNTTDTARMTTVGFNADGKTLLSYYKQVHYLNVKHPSRQNYEFLLTDSAYQQKDSIMFTVYGAWTLAFKGETPSWVKFNENTAMSGKAGTYKLIYTLDHNVADEERNAVLSLTSKNVVTDIRIRQLSNKK